MSPPRISVIMAVYNCEDYVGEAIESIQSQTETDWELICVDDCSRDRSAEIVDEYARRDERVRLVRNEQNRGAPATRNVALAHSRGEFAAVLDSDDVATPKRLELSLAAFDEDDELGVVTGMWHVIDGEGNFIKAPSGGPLPDESIRHSLLHERHRLAHSSSMIRRDLMERIGGYDVRLPAAQDYDLFLRLLPHCQFIRLGQVLLSYRYREGSISQDKALAQRLYADFARRRARACMLDESFNEEAELAHIEKLLSSDHGRSSKAAAFLRHDALSALYWGEPERARRMLRAARSYRPLDPRPLLWTALTYLPQQLISWLGDARKKMLNLRA